VAVVDKTHLGTATVRGPSEFLPLMNLSRPSAVDPPMAAVAHGSLEISPPMNLFRPMAPSGHEYDLQDFLRELSGWLFV
jgi:hypothetical protein